MTERRIIYYYQTFCGLSDILQNPDCQVTHIHLASIHFGNNPDGSPYIHLNNYPPDNPKFTKVWEELEIASTRGIKIILMMGGAGGAYTCLFNDYQPYYKLLKNTILTHPMIHGIDLDIEEGVSLNNIKMLIRYIDIDFGDRFIISMAPLGSSLEQDVPGMGGFCYKDLYNTPEGKRINYFNGQFYGNFNTESYQKCITNGYPSNKVIIGMLAGQQPLSSCLITLTTLSKQYFDFGGIFVWEYYDAPPDSPLHPGEWAIKVSQAMMTQHTSLGYKYEEIQQSDLSDY